MNFKIYFCVFIFTASCYAQDLIGIINLDNGKKINAVLYKIDNNVIRCIEYKSKKTFSIPVDKIKNIVFISEYNFANFFEETNLLDEEFLNFEKEITKYSNFMFINNNLLNHFYDYLDYLFVSERFEINVINHINTLGLSMVSSINSKGLHYECLYMIKMHEFEKAQALIKETFNEAEKIYFQALILNEQKRFKDAMKMVTQMIINHSNDTTWLPPIELLSAKIYLDLGLTNSAINTAKQVEKIYKGTVAAKIAGKIYNTLEQ